VDPGCTINPSGDHPQCFKRLQIFIKSFSNNEIKFIGFKFVIGPSVKRFWDMKINREVNNECGKIEWSMRDSYAFSHGMKKKQMHCFHVT
jgi:hypothetical protein